MLETLHIDNRIKCRDVKELVSLPRVIRVNSFNEEAVKNFSTGFSAAHQTGQPIIPVVLDVYGGEIFSLFAFVDVMKCSKLPVATIIEGKSMSAGAALFACGTKGHRYIGEHASLMIHDMAESSKMRKVEDQKADVKENDRLNRMMFALIDESMGRPNGYIWNKVHSKGRVDLYISPEKAVKMGLADHIGIPTYNTRIEVKMEMVL